MRYEVRESEAPNWSPASAEPVMVTAESFYTLAREVEAEELLGRTNAGIERAQDQEEADAARTAALGAGALAPGMTLLSSDESTVRERLIAELGEFGER
ncbi:hypothetical protein ACLVWQ_00790 [Streptomyces sp. CWNU-52B]